MSPLSCCANGSICQFEGYGTYECFINKQYIKLEKVLFSKNVHKNLISGIELAKSGFISLIDSSDGEKARLKLWDKNKTKLGTFLSSKYNQFPIKTQNFNSNKIIGNDDIMHIGKLDDKCIEIWHRRLGYFYQSNLPKYLNLHNIKTPPCIDYKISKMRRGSHKGKTSKAKELLEIIHSDISGSYNLSINNKKYFLTMKDKFSRKIWIFTLKSKAEAPDKIIEFFTYLNNQFKDYTIKIFKSDGGKEYKNKKINKYCKENSIEKMYSPPYCPEISGKAEKLITHLEIQQKYSCIGLKYRKTSGISQ